MMNTKLSHLIFINKYILVVDRLVIYITFSATFDQLFHSASIPGDNSSSPERDGQAADNNPVNQRLLSLQKQLDIELKVIQLDH